MSKPLRLITIFAALAASACGVGDPPPGTDECGDKPELPYVCANNEFPCECNGTTWECHECAAVDCTTNPNDPACEKDAACIGCHGLASSTGDTGIENSHPWSYLGCVECHGGVGENPEGGGQLTKEQSHIAIPAAMADGNSVSRPKQTTYKNYYLGRAGVENLEGGLPWIKFMNPGDLRIVEETCSKAGCHVEHAENVRRSTMSTLVGKYDAMVYLAGVKRAPALLNNLGTKSFDKRLATYGALAVTDPDWDRLTSPPGSVGELVPLVAPEREVLNPFGDFTEEDYIIEMMNKLCGDCHLSNNGGNHRNGQFRSSGCSACHTPYDFTGRSSSGDPMIPKEEPSYPEAYSHIEYPERPHPRTHQLQRLMSVNDCLPCHTGSNRTVFQYMGIRTDDNHDLVGSGANFEYSDLVDNNLNADERLRGFTEDQLVEFEDLDDDGKDDTPPDVHYEANMTCIDCHNSSEMHGDGRIYSRQNQATKIRCVHCHGNLEFAADPGDPKVAKDDPKYIDNPINELWLNSSNINRKVLWRFDTIPGNGEDGYPQVNVPGIWMRTKSKKEWKYVTQIAWGVKWNPDDGQCFGEGENIDPRSNKFVCSAESSIAHGRYNGLNQTQGDFEDGVGPRPNVEVVQGSQGDAQVIDGFSHVGEEALKANENHTSGLECTSCHAAWHNMRYGNHLSLKDIDNNGTKFYEWDRVTGESTIGAQEWFNFTFVANMDLQLGINAKGKIAYFIPTRLKMFIAGTVMDGNEAAFELMDDFGDANFRWKTYRDRVGFGNLQHNQGGLNGAPGYQQTCVETQGFCDNNDNKNINGGLGVDQMEPHTVRRETRECEDCHMNAANSNTALISAVYGWNPNGFTPATSAYLNKIASVTSHGTTYDTANGFIINDDGLAHRLDHMVDETTGYPLATTIHVRVDDGKDGRTRKGYDTYDNEAAGPINKRLIDLIKDVRVNNVQ